MADLVKRQSRSVDASRFAMVPRNDVPRSAFTMLHSHKTTFDAGWLIPVYVDEVLPGDSLRVRMTAFARLATPIVPVMDNLVLESFFFFVPNRLLWEKWERFMGEQLTPSDVTTFLLPQWSLVQGDHTGTLEDYFGLVHGGGVGAPAILVSALPFRAYNLIWNDFFRDQDLQTPVTVDVSDGPDVTAYTLLRRGKRHDYFTSARPWPQKPINMDESGVLGGPTLTPGGRMALPQSGAPVSGLGIFPPGAIGDPGIIRTSGNRSEDTDRWYTTATTPFLMKAAEGVDFPDVRVLINDIRMANVVQLMMERNARGGTRYAEIIRSHFGVVSPDARLQRPEYLGGGRTQVTVNPVAQTSASGITGSTTVMGELAGIGTAVASGDGFSQSFTEHGVILGLVSVRADLTYQQGINRMWFRRTQYDFYWPGLANLGEQPILSKEIFADGTAGVAGDDSVFGYQERWSEYKFKPARVSGRFRSNAPNPLDIWHFGQDFAARPLLNASFIVENPPVDRVLQVGGLQFEQFLFDSIFDVRAVRCMPMFSIPGLGPRL